MGKRGFHCADYGVRKSPFNAMQVDDLNERISLSFSLKFPINVK